MNRKEEIYQIIKKYTLELTKDNFINEQMIGLDATTISIQLGMTRNNVSKEMNILEREKKLIKVKSKPAIFLDLNSIEILLNKRIPEKNRNIEYIQNELRRDSKKNSYELTISKLDSLIGAKGSLSTQVEEAKAAIIYPPFGLHTFLVGETGVGKTMFAECMFNYGVMKGRFKEDAPFIAFNCADYAENTQLLLSQLFGYVKGAFTGADKDKEGVIQKANHGMLLLDEVHRLPHEGQEMLFYFLDKGAYRRLGESSVFHNAEVLVVAATTEKVNSYLLKTFSRRIPMMINIPSLEDRTLDERINLIKHFFYKEAEMINLPIKVSAQVMHVLLLYKCIGNIGQLESDIKLICAKAFLNWKENIENEIYIKYELIPNQFKNILVQQDYIDKLQDLNQQHVFLKNHFVFDNGNNQEVSKLLAYEKIQLFIKKLIELCSNQANILDLQQKKQFLKEVQELTSNFWIDLQDSIYNIQELFYKIVELNIITKVLSLTKSLNKQSIEYRFTHKSFILLCMLVNYASMNDVKQMTYNLYNWQISSKKEHFMIIELIDQLEAFLPCISKIKEYIYLLLIIDLKANSKNIICDNEHNQVEILVVSQGTSIASNMLEVAQNILNIKEGFAIDIPVYNDYKIIADTIEKKINEMDMRSDVLLLVDFVSIAALGDIIMHRIERNVKIITNVSTIMVVEGIKNAYIKLLSLEKILNLIEGINPNRLESYKDTNHEQMILVTCVSGYGTAQKIAEWVSSLEILRHTDIDIIPIGDYENEMFSDKKIIAVIGTVDLGLINIPYIPLEELVLGTGIAKLIDIVKGDTYNDNSIIIDEDIGEITLAALKRLLEFCDAQKLFNILDLTIKNLEKIYEHYSQNIYLRFITHTACMVERLIKNISLVHNKTKSVLKKYEKNYVNLKNNLNILEETYGIRIPDEEYAYILELLNDDN